MAITVGVVIPVFNRPDTLRVAIASVLSQTRQPEQIVVVDDASTSPVTLAETGSLPVETQVVRLAKNRGPASARQVGIENLTTSHVAFLDSDDRWKPDKLALQLAELAEIGGDERVAIGCGWQFESNSNETEPAIVPRGTDQLRDFVSGCWYCPGSTVLMSRAAVMQAGGFDPRLRRLEDLDFFIRFAQHGGRLEIVPFAGAVIRRGRNARIGDVREAVAIIEQKYVENGPLQLDRPTARRLAAWLALEKAAAARNEGQIFETYRNLLRSFALAPRTRLQLENWFEEQTL